MSNFMSSVTSDHGVVRALGPSEAGLLPLVSEKSFTIVYNLTLATTKPVTDDIMKTCLLEWRGHYPMLRMVIREIEGTKYFCEDQSTSIDYERVQDNWLDVFNCMLDTPFSETVPMWRVKLIDGSRPTEEFAFTYTLLISWCHVITDGTSNVIMCNNLMERLDANLGGEKLEIRENTKIYPSAEDLLPQKEYLWSEVVDALKEDLALSQGTALWSCVFPANREEPVKTAFVDLGHLNDEETSKLVAKCRSEGATVHGALLTAINIILSRAYTKQQWTSNNIADDKTEILSASAVSLRRCYETPDVLGFNIGEGVISFEVSNLKSVSFWKSVKDASKLLQEKLRAKDMARNVLTINQLHDSKQQVTEMKKSPKCLFDYGVSNMRDIKLMFPGLYKHVTVTWLARATSIQYYGFPMSFNATTYRGKFLFSVDYVTNLASQEQVRFLGHEILSCLRDNLN